MMAAMLVPHWQALSLMLQPAPVMAVDKQVVAHEGICAVSSAMDWAAATEARRATAVAEVNFMFAEERFCVCLPRSECVNTVSLGCCGGQRCVLFVGIQLQTEGGTGALIDVCLLANATPPSWPRCSVGGGGVSLGPRAGGLSCSAGP